MYFCAPKEFAFTSKMAFHAVSALFVIHTRAFSTFYRKCYLSAKNQFWGYDAKVSNLCYQPWLTASPVFIPTWVVEVKVNLADPVSITVVQLLTRVGLSATPWTPGKHTREAHQASLSITIFHGLLKLVSTELMMPSNHLILCCPLLLLPSIFSSIRVFSNESALRIRWPKYWNFSFSISPSNGYSGLISFRIDWLDFHAKGLLIIMSIIIITICFIFIPT